MWVIALFLSLVLWFVLDNFLIAFILSVLIVYFYTLLRALRQVKQAPKDTAPPEL